MLRICVATVVTFCAIAVQGQEGEVAATVNGKPIYRKEVAMHIEQALAEREVADDVRQQLEAETLQQLIKQQLVLEYLEGKNMAASTRDIDLAISRLEQNLLRQEKTLDDYFEQTGMNRNLLRRQFRWQISWQRFLEAYLTDENLQRYFTQHRRDFDGTELRVAQIFWKVTEPGELKQVVEQARRVREQLQNGELTFAEAAAKYSQAPTAADGGVQGWIKRHEPMPEAFSKTAFALKVGQVSAPITTNFGVHLIQCLEEKAGQRSWESARYELQKAVTRYLFTWAAGHERSKAKIEVQQ
jgi:parvulin-like peptidyl-prolyl isomerase